MTSVPFLAQATAGGCGACSIIMVARYFEPSLTLTEEEMLLRFGVDGFGPRCLCLAPSFSYAATALNLSLRIAAVDREALRKHLADGPVIVYHKASQALDAVPHFSVAIEATDSGIIRHDPGLGAGICEQWEDFEKLWRAATVSWWPYAGCYVALLRPKS